MLRHLTIAALLLSPLMAATAQAAQFDGHWSVSVITEKGPCDAGYRYDVNVSGGRIAYSGDAAIGLDGTVNPSGQVIVAVGRNGEHANGKGRLTATSGAGTWQGGNAQSSCAGRWEAERR
ncbi:MAG: hypothetical protein JO254_01715 [Pseudolabrys sp.]|nr:hypothetical protein [Pseudolabrys sp.]